MHQAICECESATCPGNGGGYYVTARRGPRVAWLAGPYSTHGAALADVDRVRRMAQDYDQTMAFDAFGTARVREGPYPRAWRAPGAGGFASAG